MLKCCYSVIMLVSIRVYLIGWNMQVFLPLVCKRVAVKLLSLSSFDIEYETPE